MSKRTIVSALLVPVVLATAACTSGGAAASATPGDTSGATPEPTPAQQGIAHPTGAGEIVLRFDESGGFVPVEFTLSHIPQFTLYGDGTVVFVSTGTPTQPTADGAWAGAPLRTARLTEEQVQALLEFALTDGGLAVAKAEYNNPLVADAPTAVFELHADGTEKTVSVVALGLEAEPGPDAGVRTALTGLGDRLRNFDQSGTLSSDPYQAPAYRGVLLDADGAVGVNTRPWPWADLGIDDFAAPEDPNAFQQRTRVLTPDEAAAVGVQGYENGIQSGVYLSSPDGKVYSFVLRPLLPGEAA
jgi:hypothetical protein